MDRREFLHTAMGSAALALPGAGQTPFELWVKASPLENAGKHCPPFLFFWGTRDPTPASLAVPKMVQKLRAAGVHTEFVIAEGGNHEFHDESPWFERTLQRMEEFFTAYLKQGGNLTKE